MIDETLRSVIEQIRLQEVSIRVQAQNKHDEHLLLCQRLDSAIHFVKTRFENTTDVKGKEHVLENLNGCKSLVVYHYDKNSHKEHQLNMKMQDKAKQEILFNFNLLRKYVIDKQLAFK